MSLEELLDERDVLLLSLEDLEREHQAGDLSDEDYADLRDSYTVRAARVLRALEEANAAVANSDSAIPDAATEGSAGDGPPRDAVPERSARRGRPVRRVWILGTVAVLLAVAVVSIVLVTRGTTARLPGETVSGSVSLNRDQQLGRDLAQAQTLEADGNAAGALELYHKVLLQDPTQEEALAESGWLEFEAGVQAKSSSLLSQGQAEEQKAEQADGNAYTPHLYLGSMFLVEQDTTNAVAQYRLFLADGPPTSVVRSAQPFVDRAFEGAGLTPPSLPTR